jgi:hypothetical protein
MAVVLALGLAAASCSTGGSADTRAAFCDDVARLQEQMSRLAVGSPTDVELTDATLGSIQAAFDRQAQAFRTEQPQLAPVATELSQSIGRLRDAAKTGGNVTVPSEDITARAQRATSVCV